MSLPTAKDLAWECDGPFHESNKEFDSIRFWDSVIDSLESQGMLIVRERDLVIGMMKDMELLD